MARSCIQLEGTLKNVKGKIITDNYWNIEYLDHIIRNNQTYRLLQLIFQRKINIGRRIS